MFCPRRELLTSRRRGGDWLRAARGLSDARVPLCVAEGLRAALCASRRRARVRRSGLAARFGLGARAGLRLLLFPARENLWSEGSEPPGPEEGREKLVGEPCSGSRETWVPFVCT